MPISKITSFVLSAVKSKIIKTNASFYKDFYCADEKQFKKNVLKKDFSNNLDNLAEQLENEINGDINSESGVISIFDPNFPVISENVKNNSEKPFLLFYCGDISLLESLNNNIAVIGLINPDNNIIERERIFVKQIIKNKINIVSGLAKGCDTVAHQTCIDDGGKTIAILPSPIKNIFPAENRQLAQKIIDTGGLLISEYDSEPQNRYEAIKRFTDRDRLQAMFSKTVILTASYRGGEGDSGSRFAMDAAKKYGIDRHVLFNSSTDSNNTKFGLNIDYIKNENVNVITQQNIENIIKKNNAQLEKQSRETLFKL
jgi:DNA processing protein